MEYKLICGSLNNVNDVAKTVFLNRGIQDISGFTNLNKNSLHDYQLLDNINNAVCCFLKHVDHNSNIHIICDCDTDGYTSAACIYTYIKDIFPKCRLSYSLHKAKEHGLTDDIEIPSDTNLLIIPDAGSNDLDQCKQINKAGIDIIILDHHECDIDNPYAIVVNNQMCDYPNKQLCGVGIVYKFLQAVDEETWNNIADKFLDLVALGLIADNMDVRSPETRYLIDKGLSKIKNKLFKTFIEKQSYLLGNKFTGKDIQFYVVPLINAMIRAGDSDEKDMLFRAFIESDEIFKYKKRGDKTEVDENIYDRVARLCVNAKSRQNITKEKSLNNIYKSIEKRGYDKNKVIFANVTKILDETMTGVTAIKVAEHYGKPTLLLRRKNEDANLYCGSGRNIDNSPLKNLKNFLNELNVFDYVQGHQGAFGFQIQKDKIPYTIDLINQKLNDMNFRQCLDADFIISSNDLTIGLIKDINDLRHYYGTGFKEPIVIVEGISVDKEQFSLMGKEKNNWKIITDEGVALVKFKAGKEDRLIDLLRNNNTAKITVAGRANINNYKGILTCQLVVIDYEIEVS